MSGTSSRAKGRKPAAKAKRPAKAKPLVAETAAVRRQKPRARPAKGASTATSPAPMVPAFAMMGAMGRALDASLKHTARLAACRSPAEFWFEHMRFGQRLYAECFPTGRKSD